MKIQEIRKKSDQDLKKLLGAAKENVRHTRFKMSSKELKNPHELRGHRKDIARILTVLKERADAK